MPDGRPGTSLLAGRIVVIDVETTGWSAASHDVIEVGCVTLDGGSIGAEWSSLVRIGHPIPPESTRIHGITDADLGEAPAPAAVAAEFRRRCGSATLAVHNAAFDLPFLDGLLRRHGGEPLYNPVVDTLGLARGLAVVPGGNSLIELAQQLGIPHDTPHRALSDARATAALLKALAPRWEFERNTRSLAELAAASQDAIRLSRRGSRSPAPAGV
jgi:DNA polymerase III epsilon subunit family exonuclease